jgi:dienelactone hydrolase
MREKPGCKSYVVIGIATLLGSLGAQAQTNAPASAAPAADERAAAMAAMAAMRERQNATPDTPGTGRYPASKETPASLPNHTVYRPTDLSKLGSRKLGIYLFGNGACSTDGASARLHLLEIASHGYLAIAPGKIRNGPGAVTTEEPPAAATAQDNPAHLPRPSTSSADLLAALDWALAQNADANSPLHGKIDGQAIAVSGFSCGGLQALQIAADPRFKTLIVMNSGIFKDSTQGINGINVTKDLLATLHTPTLYILGGETDIAYANGMDDVARIAHVPVYVGNLEVGHGGTYWQPNGGKAAAAVVAWLDWQLRGDAKAKKMFVGKDCGLCRDPAWKFAAKVPAKS